MNEKMSPVAKRAVAIALCINLLAGAQYCWSMLGSSLMKSYGWTAMQASLPYSVMMVVTSLWAMVVGKFADKTGPHFLIRVGSFCIAASLIIAGHTDNWWLVMFAIGGLMGIASTSFTANTNSTAIKLVPLRYKGMATGLVSAGIAWTSFYMAPVINKLLKVTNVANTFTIIGVSCGVAIFILSFLLPNPIDYPELVTPPDTGENDVDHSKYKNNCQTLGQIAAKKETWILLLIFACAGMSGQMLTSQMNNIAIVHVGLESGASLIMAMGICNGLGRFVVGAISDKIGVCNTYRLIYVGVAVSMLLMMNAHGFGMMLLAVIIMGLFYGGGTALIWAADAMVFGKKYVASVNGIVTNGFAVAALIGPTLASHFVDTTGGYGMAFVAVIVFCVIGIVLTFGVKENYDN